MRPWPPAAADAAAAAVRGAHHFAPVNDARNMIPFFAVFLISVAEFAYSADLPTIKMCETAYWVDV